MTNKITEMLYGKEFADKEELFNNGLLKIEKKYSDWFKGRKSMFFKEKQDTLKEHLLTETVNVKRMGFNPKSELPDYIREEVTQLFLSIF